MGILAAVAAITLTAASSAAASVRARHLSWPTTYRVVHGSVHGPVGRRIVRDRALSSRAREAIVGGSQIAITQAPWQVFVVAVVPISATEYLILLCGGSVINETHVVTAGHCMFDPETGAGVPAEDVLVVAGTSNFEAAEPEEQAIEIENIRVHPYFEYSRGPGASDDVAVLALDKPLTFDGSVQPIGLVGAGATLDEGALVNLTGFGRETPNGKSEGPLHSLGMTVGFSRQCGGEADAVFLCASATAGSGCSGDSGSGLTYGSTPILVGVMDTDEIISGEQCGSGSNNGFVNIAAPEIREFIEGNENPPMAPRGGMVRVRAVPTVGNAAMCESGSWSGSPTFAYTFTNSVNKEVLQSGGSASYQLTKADVGMTIACEVLASNAGGTGVSRTTALPAITDPEESGNGSGSSGPSQGSIESGNEAAARAVKEYEAQRAALERKAREETEAIERAQREVESREALAKAAARKCVVPSLKGDSLGRARHALSKAHCKLGKVAMSRGSSSGSLVVKRQKTTPGKKLPAGTRIGVTMGSRR